MSAFLQDVAYAEEFILKVGARDYIKGKCVPLRTGCDPTLKSICLLTSISLLNMHCSHPKRADTVSALHKQSGLSLQAWILELAVLQLVAH